MKREKFLMSLLIILVILSLAIGIGIMLKPQIPIEGTGETKVGATKAFLSMLSSTSGPGIAVVKVYGIIQTQTTETIFDLPVGGSDSVVRKIRNFRKNDDVKAIVLRVNSPGGSIGAAQEIVEEIKKAKDAGKKIVVSMGDMAASGGYYISCVADKIIANPGTITASIGVYVGTLNVKGLGDKLGIHLDIIKSGKYKDTLSGWRDMTEDERQLLTQLVDTAYQQFLDQVSEGRNIPKAELMKIADGRIMLGEEAMQYKLVDQLGTFQDAITEAAKLAGIEGEPRIIKDTKTDFELIFDFFAEAFNKRSTSAQTMIFGREVVLPLPITYLYPGLGVE